MKKPIVQQEIGKFSIGKTDYHCTVKNMGGGVNSWH